MEKSEIIAEIQARIKIYSIDIKLAADRHSWRVAYELTIARDALINLLSALGEL